MAAQPASEFPVLSISGIKAGQEVVVLRSGEHAVVTATVCDVRGKEFFRVQLTTGQEVGRTIALNPDRIVRVEDYQVPKEEAPVVEETVESPVSSDEEIIVEIRTQEQIARKEANEKAKAERAEVRAQAKLAKEDAKTKRAEIRAAKAQEPKTRKISMPPNLSLEPAMEGEGLCQCGCGETAGKGAHFRPGHDARLKGRLIRFDVWRESHPEKRPEDFAEYAAIPVSVRNAPGARCSCCGQPMLLAHESGMGPICRAGQCTCAQRAG